MQTAKREIARLRAIVSLGLNNLLLLTDSYKVRRTKQNPDACLATDINSCLFMTSIRVFL